MPLSANVIATLRSRTVCLPTKPLVCSNDPNDIYLQDGYDYDGAMNREMDCLAKFIFLTGITYLQSMELFGSKGRVLRSPEGSRRNSGATIYDLFVPLRALRHWASIPNIKNNWNSLKIQHVFTPQHWFEILRVVSMVYDQEHRRDSGASTTIFLSQERIFGPAWRNEDSSIYTLYDMFRICQHAVGEETFLIFQIQHEGDDSHPNRLKNLTVTHRNRLEDEGYYLDEDMPLTHVLPLHPFGLQRTNGDRVNRKGLHPVSIKPYDPVPHKRFVYCRDASIVEVSISDDYPMYMTMSSKPIPDSFFDEFDVYMKAPTAGYIDETDTSYYMLNEVIEHVNEGNYHAAQWLFSQVLNGRLVAERGKKSSWFKYQEDDGEPINEAIHLKAICDVIGLPLETKDGDIVLPVSSDGQFCYLTKTQKGQDFYAEWGSAKSTKVVAQVFSKFNKHSKLLSP